MNGNTVEIDVVQRLVADIDRLIDEMLQVRRRINSLRVDSKIESVRSSIREAEWFGMWADREDIRELSSREWLTQQRNHQWTRP